MTLSIRGRAREVGKADFVKVEGSMFKFGCVTTSVLEEIKSERQGREQGKKQRARKRNEGMGESSAGKRGQLWHEEAHSLA